MRENNYYRLSGSKNIESRVWEIKDTQPGSEIMHSPVMVIAEFLKGNKKVRQAVIFTFSLSLSKDRPCDQLPWAGPYPCQAQEGKMYFFFYRREGYMLRELLCNKQEEKSYCDAKKLKSQLTLTLQ